MNAKISICQFFSRKSHYCRFGIKTTLQTSYVTFLSFTGIQEKMFYELTAESRDRKYLQRWRLDLRLISNGNRCII